MYISVAGSWGDPVQLTGTFYAYIYTAGSLGDLVQLTGAFYAYIQLSCWILGCSCAVDGDGFYVYIYKLLGAGVILCGGRGGVKIKELCC